MPGKRQPTAVVEANGRKHLSQAEKAKRLAGEVQAPPSKDYTPPRFLPKKLAREFSEMAEKLAKLGLFTDFDRDVLGQYFLCRDRWQAADKKAARAIRADDDEQARAWTTVQGSYFKQARQCAESMGLSITSRCRLVVPQASPKPEDNPFGQLIVLPGAVNG